MRVHRSSNRNRLSIRSKGGQDQDPLKVASRLDVVRLLPGLDSLVRMRT